LNLKKKKFDEFTKAIGENETRTRIIQQSHNLALRANFQEMQS